MDAIEVLLERGSHLDLKASDIARLCDCSTPTFYVYFENVTAAIYEVVLRYPQATPEIMRVLERKWGRSSCPDVREFVALFVANWEKNYHVLRARNVVADSGNPLFLAERSRSLTPLRTLLLDQVAVAKDNGAIPQDVPSRAISSFLLAGLERVGFAARIIPERSLVSDNEMIEAMTYNICTMMGIDYGLEWAGRRVAKN